MKSVKHFLHSFGTSGRVPEGCKFPGGDDVSEGTALPDSRPDILTSVKKECVQRKPSSLEPRPPDIRMATNANGNLFPVICNVRTKETKTGRTGDSGVPARANGLRTFRRCVTNNRQPAGQHQGTSISGLPVIRPSMTLRVSSVPSKPPETEPTTRSLLPTSTATTLTRRRTKGENPEAKNVGLTNNASKHDQTSAIGADERNGRSDDGAGKRWFKGDHNTNGLPLYEVPPQTRIPRLGASSSGVPTRTLNAVALRPVGLRRSTSDISQNACSNGNLLKVGTTPGGCMIEAPSNVIANTTDSGIGSVLVAQTQAAKKSDEEEASTSDADGETTMTTPNGKKKNGNAEAPSKACGNKPKSKSRCQRRIWSFSLPRFMRSHSSPKLNSDSLPSEESRSSTLPRLKTGEDGDSGSSNNGGHLFKVTSLTSLHDLPGQAPKSCLSHGDVSIAGDYPPVKSQVSDQEEQRQSPAGSAGSPHGAKVFAVTGSRSSSDNGTDNGTTERPYIMPPRALRKYIKTNFRRLNVPEGTATESERAQLDGQQPSGPAADALSSKTDLPTKTCTAKASAAEASNGFPLLALKSESDKERAPTGPPEAGKHVPHAAVDITEGVIGDHGASVTDENNKESAQKGVVALKSEKLPFGPRLDSNHKLFTEKVDIHRAVPATVRLVHSNDTGVVPTESSVSDDKISKRNSICIEISEDRNVKFEGNTSAAEMTSVQSEDAASHGSDLEQTTQTPDEVTVVHDAAPAEVLANGADVPAGLERQVDGASCSESLSSFESEMTLAEKLGKRIQSTSRKLRVLDRPTLNSGTLRKPGGSFQVVVGSSSSAGTRKGKKYSCERIRQLESEVWLAERELLLLKEKVP
ncbi:uncharacterized protein ISCGN_009803 [Ixodes scapularis]